MAKAFNVLLCFFVCLQLVNCQFGFLGNIRNTISDTIGGAISAVDNILRPRENPPVSKPTTIPKKDPPVIVKTTEKAQENDQPSTTQIPNLNQDRPVSTVQRPNENQGRPVSAVQRPNENQDRPVSAVQRPNEIQDRPVSAVQRPNENQDRPVSAVQKPNANQNRPVISTTTKYAGEPCLPVNGGAGECVVISACQPYMQVIRNTPNSPVITWMLRKSHCGFDGNDPKVCCPTEEDNNDEKLNQIEPVTSTKPTWPATTLPTTTSTLPPTTTTLPTTTSTLPPTTSTLPSTTSTLPPTTSTLPTSSLPVVSSTRRSRPLTPDYNLLSLVGETCTTVYNTTGSCMDLYLCEPMLALAKQARANPAAGAVLKKSACGFKGQIPQVCCPLPYQSTDEIPSTTTQTPTTTSSEKLALRSNGDFLTALPEPPVCGLSNISLDRVVGGVPAKLGAFPWMVLLGYRDLSVAAGMKWQCGGALVSTRHVLTAAHCIHNLEDDLFLVRLGELDLARDNEGATPIDVPIKTMYKHELYTRNNPVINDVGVLVLEKDVQFTDLIKPICLFTASSNMWKSETFEDYNPFVAGWGDVKWDGIRATHLQVAQLPVLGDEECERAYRNNIRVNSREQFSQQAMCAGYAAGKIDSCKGDSGGPLMQPLELEGRTPRTYIFAIGVVSFGRKCAQAGSPGVYARVAHYMPWIEEKILGRAS